MTSVKPKKHVFWAREQLLHWVLESLNAHISKYWFSRNWVFAWLARVVPSLLGVFLSVFECFWVFLSVFECFWVFLSPNKQCWAILKGFKGVLAKKKRVLSIFDPKTTWSQIILVTIAEFWQHFGAWMTSVKPKKWPKQLLYWVLKSLKAHISQYFSKGGT